MPIRPTEIWVNPGYDDYFEHNNIVQIKTHFCYNSIDIFEVNPEAVLFIGLAIII